MRLGIRGVQLLVAGLALVAAGIVFGQSEAIVLGCAAIVLLATSAIETALRRPTIAITRTLSPSHLYAGDECEIRIGVRNLSPRRLSSIRLYEPVQGLAATTILFDQLEPAETQFTTFVANTNRRGRFEIGPSSVTTTDPLGLTYWKATEHSNFEAIRVWPRTWILDLEALGPIGRDSQHSSDDEFSNLHEYAPGDDIRLIHWPTTARVGTPMVRQFETEVGHDLMVIVDTDTSPADENAFERTLSACASIIRTCADTDSIRVVAVSRSQPQVALDLVVNRRDSLHFFAVLDRLSDLVPTPTSTGTPPRLDSIIESLGANDCPVVVCSPSPDAALQTAGSRATLSELLVISTASSFDVPAVQFEVRWDGAVDLTTAWSAYRTTAKQ